MKQETYLGVVFGILMAFTYSLMAIFVKLATKTSNETLIFYRSILSFVFLLPVVFFKGKELKTAKRHLHWVRSVSGLIAMYCYFYTLKHLSLLNSVLLANTMPLFVPLVIWFWLKEKVALKRILSIALGFIGVVLILNPTREGWNSVIFVGLGTGLFAAIALVGVRQLAKQEKPFSILFYFFFLSAVLSLFPFLMKGEFLPYRGEWGYVVALGAITIIYQFFMTKTYTYFPASKAAGFLYVSLIFGGFFDWIIWGKIPGFMSFLGVLFIATGGLLTLYEKPKLKLK